MERMQVRALGTGEERRAAGAAAATVADAAKNRANLLRRGRNGVVAAAGLAACLAGLSLGPGEAAATCEDPPDCAAEASFVSPPNGAVHVPTNALVWAYWNDPPPRF